MTCTHKHSCGCGSLSNANIKAVIEGLLTTALDEKDFDALELKNSIYQNLLRIGDVQDKLNDFKADIALNLSALITKTEIASIKSNLENLIIQQQNIYEDLQRDFEAVTSQKLLDYKSDVQDIQQDVAEQLNTVQNQLASLVPTRDAYKIAVQNGFVGSEASWLDSLKGHSAYELAKAHGFRGSEAEWLSSLKGDTGPTGDKGAPGADGISAYEVARNNGFSGSEPQWLVSLAGKKGERGVGVANVNHNSDDTLTFLYTDNTSYTSRSLKGAPGIQGIQGLSPYELAVQEGFNGTVKEWLTSLKPTEGTLQALEKFMSNDADTTVNIPEFGEIPSLQGYIAEMFQNGVLPANPFETHAEMLANGSSLEDLSMAIVLDDLDPKNNGLYQKRSGVWQRTDWQVGGTSEEDASKAELEELSSISNFEPIELKRDFLGLYSLQGVKKESNTVETSQKIAVKKGDCILITNNPLYTGGSRPTESQVSMVNANGEFESSLSAFKRWGFNDFNAINRREIEGFYNLKHFFNTGVVIPRDGFIVISTAVKGSADIAINPLNAKGTPQSVYKTDFKGLFSTIPTYIPHSYMELFKESLVSLEIDKNLKNDAGVGLINPVKREEDSKLPAIISGGYSVVYQRIAVRKGQYINLFVKRPNANSSSTCLVFVDAEDNYVRTINRVTEYGIGAKDFKQYLANIPVKEDGFIRVVSSNYSPQNAFISVTDTPITTPKEYITSGMQLNFYKHEAGSYVLMNNNSTFYRNPFIDFIGSSAPTAPYTVSRPYRIKKGDVFEYSLDSSVYPVLAYVFNADTLFEDVDIFTVRNEGMTLTDFSGIGGETGETYLKYLHLNSSTGSNLDVTNPLYLKAPSLKTVYCNEDSDMVVIFFRPNLDNPLAKKHFASEGYSLKVYTKEEYKRVRDKDLKEQFKTFTAMAPSLNGSHSVKRNLVGLPPVLLFKGEVLNYLATSNSESFAKSVNYLDSFVGVEDPVEPPLITSINKNLRPTLGTDFPEIKKNNIASYNFNQIYAHETCLVLLSERLFNLEGNSLDTDNMFKDGWFEPRIVNLKDIVIGSNIQPVVHTFKNTIPRHNKETGKFDVTIAARFPDSLVIASFAPKNSFVECEWWSHHTTNTYAIAPLVPNNVYFDGIYNRIDKVEAPLYQSNVDDDGFYVHDFIEAALNKDGVAINNDSVIYVPCHTTMIEGSVVDITSESSPFIEPDFPRMADTFNYSLRTISEDFYNQNYRVTDLEWLNVPKTESIRFNFCTSTGIKLDVPILSKVQLISDNQVVAVFNALTENQGQSSAHLVRKNVNMELYNSNMDKCYVMFGDQIEEQEFVLKSYLLTDKGHFKDSTGAEFWASMRKAAPYPKGTIIPREVREDLSNPTNQKALGTTFGFPVELHRGGSFASLATIRNKKKRENYAMEKNNPDHILLQADYQSMGTIKWNLVQLGNFEVRNPKISGYKEGDSTLPEKWATTEADINRLITWMRDGFNNPSTIRESAEEYIDIESFIDYSLAVVVTSHWDGVHNNFLLGTYNRRIWHAYWYDSDQIWGTRIAAARLSPYQMLTGYFWDRFLNEYANEAKYRYAYLRRNKIIDPKTIQDMILGTHNYINSYAKKKDAEYWGPIFTEAGALYSMEWIYNRIAFLDTVYGYVDSQNGVVHTQMWNPPSLPALNSKTVVFRNTLARVGEEYYVEFGDGTQGTVMTATCENDGEITVTHSNPTDSDINLDNRYIKIIKLGY